MHYTVEENPPWALSLLLGFQVQKRIHFEKATSTDTCGTKPANAIILQIERKLIRIYYKDY